MSEAYLEIATSEGVKRVTLTEQPVTIGRLAENVVPLDDHQVSRRHCVVEQVDSGYQIRDLGSRNGTKVNDYRVITASLTPGDAIIVGTTEMVLVVPGADVIALSPQAKEEGPVVRKGVQLKRSLPRTGKQGQDGKSSGEIFLGDDTDEMADLRDLMASLPQIPFDDGDIALINARDIVVHETGSELGNDDESVQNTVRVLRLLLYLCFRIRATDLHLEPKRDAHQVRVRVDGLMVEVCSLNQTLGAQVGRVVKVLAEIDISHRNVVQDGHIAVRVPGRRVDYRVSFTPTVHGQKLVLRILDLANAPKFMRELDLPDWMNRTLHQVTRQDQGMVLVCGPTGSGKTTSLYAVIRNIDFKRRNVVTIEDPVEYQIEGVTQLPINEDQGNSFYSLLRSVLRQDPDVILVGEIRDLDTARVAMQAAITGHLVLSTVHAKDCLGTIHRLLDLDVEPYLVASGLNIVLSQRLVRILCPQCKQPAKLKPHQTRRFNQIMGSAPEVYSAVGCPACLDTGYSGRRGTFELLTTNDEVRDAILKGANLKALRAALSKTMFRAIQESGYRLVAEGVTSFDELDRVIGTTE